jgi:glutaredoxin 3
VRIRAEIDVAKVQVYTTRYCPWCVRAKMLLRSRGIDFEEIDVTYDDQLRSRMIERAGGRRTVPEIFINGNPIGGYEELKELDDSGELMRLLEQSA